MDLYTMAIPGALGVEIEIDPSWPQWFARHARMIESGVCSDGDAAAHALVWEWGNTRQEKQGPRTVKGQNPAGASVWLSSQAPEGWIAINEPDMWDAIDRRMASFDLEGNTEGAMSDELERISLAVSNDILKILHSTVPVDSGDLDHSLRVVEPGDPLLDQIEDHFSEMEGGVTSSGILLIDRDYDSPLNG